jgi:hypothetical protein
LQAQSVSLSHAKICRNHTLSKSAFPLKVWSVGYPPKKIDQIERYMVARMTCCFPLSVDDRTNMLRSVRLALHASDGDFDDFLPEIGHLLHSHTTSSYAQPVFHVYGNTTETFVILRCTRSFFDILTDLDCFAIEETNSDGTALGSFHRGFWRAANWVFNEIKHYLIPSGLTPVPPGPVHFIGHSYGASVASILCLLMSESESPRPFMGWAFGPAAAMDAIADSRIHDSLFTFANDRDFVPKFGHAHLPCVFDMISGVARRRLMPLLQNGDGGAVQAAMDFVVSNLPAFARPVLLSVLGAILNGHDLDPSTVVGRLMMIPGLVGWISESPYLAALVLVPIAVFMLLHTQYSHFGCAGKVVELIAEDVEDEAEISWEGWKDHGIKRYAEAVFRFVSAQSETGPDEDFVVE